MATTQQKTIPARPLAIHVAPDLAAISATASSPDPAFAQKARRRRSSSLLYKEPPETPEERCDQAVLPNMNAQWVNHKGAWAIHIVLITLLKILYDLLPLSQETTWTLTNLSYMAGSYLMFHYVQGTPFEHSSGAYDRLNMWEQMDDGAQYTPAKKFLLTVPIFLFLFSVHYTHYTLGYFVVNCLAVVVVTIPKLPSWHRVRTSLFSGDPDDR